MEMLDGYLKELQKTFDLFRQEDVKSFEIYESSMRATIESQVAPGMKKQRTSLDEDLDSGVDATTITTSTQASTATSSSAGNARPSRSAKTAASGNLKLPKLGTKLRQEIKLERITETSTISTKSDAKENDFNSLNIKREKISIGVRSQSSNRSDTDRDSSILVIPNEVNIITLSDDDDDDVEAADEKNKGGHNDFNKMPPPMLPAPKKLPTKTTRANQKGAESSTSDISSSQNSEASSSSSTVLEAKKTKKGKKTKKPVLPMIEIKQEKVTEDDVVDNSVDARVKKPTKSKKSAEKADSDAGSKNATLESVYEDASDKIPPHPLNSLVPSATYVLHKNSNRENGRAPNIVNNTGKSKASLSSILTEDNSDEEEPIQLPKNTKKQKELFNPLVQSPMKAKVAAFEKLQEFSSPAQPIRQTRTKTRQLAKQNSESSTASNGSTNSTSKLPKPTTPSVELRYPVKDHTPLGKSIAAMKTYSASNAQRSQLTSSSSVKIGSTTMRPASAQPAKVRSRDNSVEDQARAREAMEKKRKNDERVKRAQMQREAQEKEKLDKMEKLMKLKQEKEAAKEAAREEAKKLKQQELQKLQKAAEEKRERERKRLQAELEEAAKLERDQNLRKKIADEKAHLDQIKLIRKDDTKAVLTFDMLETDDSTDDEETVSKNRPHRPPPPAWSLRANAKRDIILQSGINVNTIDKLFSCAPTTPDLAAIFPKIDSKHLQRNSSAFWNTPPRYSELPKY